MITRRQFNLSLASAASLAASGTCSWPASGAETSAIDWTSDDPHLSGNYASIGPEIDAADLQVVSGRIPASLHGAYMRNGPNPRFKPISYAYPMDGDGMIHAVYLENGRARYRNRYVRTSALDVERRSGRAVYGSFTHPVPVDPALIRPGEPRGPFKNGAFINVIRHGGHLLALNEATPCYELTMDLDTVGEWKAGTDSPIRLGAHNRRHPKSGMLFTLAYSESKPSVQFHQIDASGIVAKTFSIDLDIPTMIHDFVLTERYIVVIAGPGVFDADKAHGGKPVLQWQPERGTRIGLIALDGRSATWLDTEPFFVFHFGNGFERGGHIFVDYVRHDRLHFGYGTVNQKNPTLHRMDIDIARRRVSDAEITGLVTEFPRINDAFNALPAKFVYLPTLTDTLPLEDPPSATFNTMMRVDVETGAIVKHDFGNRIAGEPTFIPRRHHGREDDGYIATFAFNPVDQTSDFILLDASRLNDEPVAVVRMPQRVPQGLHGNWMPST